MPSFDTPTNRCLLVVGKAGGGVELTRLRELRPGRQLELRVLAPAFVRSRMRYLASDVDDAIRSARRRLDTWLDELHSHRGVHGHGEVGDPDPLLAIDTSLASFAADEIVIVPSERRRHWGEKRLLERAWTHFEVPVLRLETTFTAESYRPPEPPATPLPVPRNSLAGGAEPCCP